MEAELLHRVESSNDVSSLRVHVRAVDESIRTVLDPRASSARTAGLDKLHGLSQQARTVLAREGIDTVDKLASAKTGDLAKLLTRANVATSEADAAQMIGLAKTLNGMG